MCLTLLTFLHLTSVEFDRAFHKITATDCDTVRPAAAPKAFGAMARQARLAERWQKDKRAEKWAFPYFSAPPYFCLRFTSAFCHHNSNFAFALWHKGRKLYSPWWGVFFQHETPVNIG
jgi:hypothetical protein